MKQEQTSYSTSDMLKLINTAAGNLVLRKSKVSLEAQIRRQQAECDYTRELLTRARKMVSGLDPEIVAAEKRARESKERLMLLKSEREALAKELEGLRAVARKVEMLKQITGKAATLRESVEALQKSHDHALSLQKEKRVLKEEISRESNKAVAAVQELKGKIGAVRASQDRIIARLSGFDISSYIAKIQKDVDDMAARLQSKSDAMSVEEEINLLVACLQQARKTDDISRIFEETSAEEMKMFADFAKIKESGVLSSIKAEIKRMIASFDSSVRKELSSLEERKHLLDSKLEITEERLSGLKAGMAQTEQEIKSEQEFRARSQATINKLEEDSKTQAAELDRLKKEEERVHLEMEFNKVFITSVGPSIEYLKNMNKKLSSVFEGCKAASNKLAGAVKK
ncbi:MAG: hypothetical protein HQL10_05535 [Nitrospirae bacterium]|nr:hypothetical protein [Nitrospirota bacterium]